MAEVTEIRSRSARVSADGASTSTVASGAPCRPRSSATSACAWDSVRARAARRARIAAAEPAQAWERALRLLNFRERGSGELRATARSTTATPPTSRSGRRQRARDLGLPRRPAVRRGAGAQPRPGQAARPPAGRRRAGGQGRRRGARGRACSRSAATTRAERERAVALARALTASRAARARRLASRLVSQGLRHRRSRGVSRREVAEACGRRL